MLIHNYELISVPCVHRIKIHLKVIRVKKDTDGYDYNTEYEDA